MRRVSGFSEVQQDLDRVSAGVATPAEIRDEIVAELQQLHALAAARAGIVSPGSGELGELGRLETLRYRFRDDAELLRRVDVAIPRLLGVAGLESATVTTVPR